MRRLEEYEIGGRTLYLNFSVSAACGLAERFGSLAEAMETLGAKLQSGENETEGFQSLAQIIAEMAVQGKRYRDLMGEKTDKPWSAEELMVLLPYDPAELTNLVNKLQEAMENGQKPTVAVAEEKNAEAMPEGTG